jgi:hypothetical protein
MLHLMKSFLTRFALLFVFTAASVFAASFEGRITLGMKSGKDKEFVIAYAIKEGLCRMEPKMEGGEGFASITNWKTMETIVLMSEQRMYMVMPLKRTVNAASEATAAHDTKLEKTGETETILGYVCEKYIATDKKGETTELWATDKLGNFMGVTAGNPMAGMMGGGGRGKKGGWEEMVKGKDGFFPLRVVGKSAKGKESFRMEAKSIEPGALPDSLFAPPDGFQKFQMPNLGDMFKG